MDDDEVYYDSRSLATLLNVSVRTVDDWASEGRGPKVTKVGRLRRYAPSDVRAWLAEQNQEGDA